LDSDGGQLIIRGTTCDSANRGQTLVPTFTAIPYKDNGAGIRVLEFALRSLTGGESASSTALKHGEFRCARPAGEGYVSSEHLQRLNGLGDVERISCEPLSYGLTKPQSSAATAPVQVLLVGGANIGFWPLSAHLEQSGYRCECVSNCLDAARLVARRSFELVLCSVRMKAFELLLTAVRHSSASLFRYVLVEDGCWWVPSVLRGEPCSSTFAFRETQFANALDTMVREVRAHRVGM
jgi:hypothetical protein